LNASIGTINFFGSHIGAWEADVTDGVYERFRSTLARLVDHRGFRATQDPSAHKLLRSGRYDGRKGDLFFRAECTGRTFSFEFFGEGGRYQYDRFVRMPKPLQYAGAVEMSHLLRKLGELGYAGFDRRHEPAGIDPLSVLHHARGEDRGTPLERFNRLWNFGSDWARGGRFERDESGWPSARSMLEGRREVDADGLPVEVGSLMYCRDDRGRLFRGVARPCPNGQWILLGPSETTARAWAAKDLFRDIDGAPRRFVRGQKERLRKEIDEALKAENYGRVAVLARAVQGVAS
jgi:hypothetical protein